MSSSLEANQSRAAESVCGVADSAAAVTYIDGPSESMDDMLLSFRYYCSRSKSGDVMVGVTANISFTLDRPPCRSWRYFKDFNLWHNGCDHYYSGVVGDLEGQTFRLSKLPNEPGPHQYRVVKVIPEHLIEFDQPGSWSGGTQPFDGYGVYMLNSNGDGALVTILMQHASQRGDQTLDEALAFWETIVEGARHKWRDSFVPTLKKLVSEDRMASQRTV